MSTESPGTPPDQPQSGGAPPPPGGGTAPSPQGAPPMGQPGGPMVPGGSPLQTRESVVEWLLCAFIPFYSIYWLHRASKEMQAWSGGRIDYNATSTILSLTLGWIIIVPPFVSLASFAGRVRESRQMSGLPTDVGFGGFFLRLLLFGYGYKWMTDKLNEVAVRQPQA